jgi:predicted DsbA family dithiol-disulfide isomerase
VKPGWPRKERASERHFHHPSGIRGVPTFLIGGSDVIKGYNAATLREKLL